MSLFHIEHIVIVVMENRSFDHMLGYLSIPPPLGAGRQDVLGLSGNGGRSEHAGVRPAFCQPPGEPET